MNFVVITAGQTDSNSPVDVALMDTIRTNLDQLNSDLVTNGDAHDHAGGDGGQIPQLGLKTSTQTATVTPSIGASQSTNIVLTGGEYRFGLNEKIALDSGPTQGTMATDDNVTHANTSYVGIVKLTVNNAASSISTGTILQRYVSASPPYKIGNVEWGHFLYTLADLQGNIIAAYESPDPPYAYNGSPQNKKDSIERIKEVPHPFADYFDKDPAIDGLEISLIDLREHDTKKWKADNEKHGKGILEDLGHINKKGQIIMPQELGIGNIQGFTDKIKIRKA